MRAVILNVATSLLPAALARSINLKKQQLHFIGQYFSAPFPFFSICGRKKRPTICKYIAAMIFKKKQPV